MGLGGICCGRAQLPPLLREHDPLLELAGGVKNCQHRVIPNLSALDLKPRATGLSLLRLEEGCMC